MKLLILDFLRRWWWLLAGLAAISVVTAAGGAPFVWAPIAMVCLMMDEQRGVLRVVRPLPIARRVQAGTWWFVGVLLVPLLAVVALSAGNWIYLAMHSPAAATMAPPEVVLHRVPLVNAFISPTPDYSPWFASAVQWWVGLGCSALCFLLAMLLPKRPLAGLWENLGYGLLSAVWGSAMPGLPFLATYLPNSVAAVVPWHWAVFAAVPFCVVLSFLAAPDMLQRRLAATGQAARIEPASADHAGSGGLTGVPLYLVTFVGRMVLILFLMAVMFSMISGKERWGAAPILAGQAVAIAIALGAFTVEAIELRVLRALPLSTARLAMLLLAMPVILGVCGAGLTAGWAGVGDPGLPPALNFGAQALAIAGCGSLALAISLHFISGARLVAPIALVMMPTLGFFRWAKEPALLAIVGALTLVLAFGLLHRGLRRCPAFYQPRRLFGMSLAQPLAGRS